MSLFPHATNLQHTTFKTIQVKMQKFSVNKEYCFNPFPTYRHLLTKLLKISNFSFCHNVFNFFHLWRVSMFLPRCFQSLLLQICCMWERVNRLENITTGGKNLTFEQFLLLLQQIDGFMQNGCNFILNKMKLQPFCMKPRFLTVTV